MLFYTILHAGYGKQLLLTPILLNLPTVVGDISRSLAIHQRAQGVLWINGNRWTQKSCQRCRCTGHCIGGVVRIRNNWTIAIHENRISVPIVVTVTGHLVVFPTRSKWRKRAKRISLETTAAPWNDFGGDTKRWRRAQFDRSRLPHWPLQGRTPGVLPWTWPAITYQTL